MQHIQKWSVNYISQCYEQGSEHDAVYVKNNQILSQSNSFLLLKTYILVALTALFGG